MRLYQNSLKIMENDFPSRFRQKTERIPEKLHIRIQKNDESTPYKRNSLGPQNYESRFQELSKNDSMSSLKSKTKRSEKNENIPIFVPNESKDNTFAKRQSKERDKKIQKYQ